MAPQHAPAHAVATDDFLLPTTGAWPLTLSDAARDVAARLTRWGIEVEPMDGHLLLRAPAGVIWGLRRGHSVTADVYRHRDELWRMAVQVRLPTGAEPS